MTICLNSINFIWVILFSIVLAYFMYIRKSNKYTFIFVCTRTIYLILLLAITLLPITILSKNELEIMHTQYGEYIKYYQLVPFKTILSVGRFNFFRQVICNIILFIPLPIIIKINYQKLSNMKVIFVGIISSVVVELIQLIINVVTRYPSHVMDIDDIILNSMGILIGYAIYRIIIMWKISRSLLERIVYQDA